MNEFVRRMTAPLMRLTTVVEVNHEPVFAHFAKIVEQAVLEERVRREPRVVSFRAIRSAR
jgi:hypothetical protein